MLVTHKARLLYQNHSTCVMCLLYISITCLTLKKSFTETRLQEKEKLLQNLQSQYHDLGQCPALTSGCSHMLFLAFSGVSPKYAFLVFQSSPLSPLMRLTPRSGRAVRLSSPPSPSTRRWRLLAPGSRKIPGL